MGNPPDKFSFYFLELKQRAHSPPLAVGLASEYKLINSLQSEIPRCLRRGASNSVTDIIFPDV